MGHTLAPKQYWAPSLENPGLRSLTIEGRRIGRDDGTVFVKVEPSSVVQPGVYIEVSEQYVRAPDNEGVDAQWVPSCLNKNWDSVMNYAKNMADDLLANLENS